jgi:DNA-directed RNA polymerase specialized sigma24 family protein
MTTAEQFADLIRRVRGGDDAAAEDLFKRYGRVFLKKIKNRLEGSAIRAQVDCDDICQSVFGSLFVRLRWGQYELGSEHDLVALLRKMADNKVIAKIRKGAVRPDVQGRAGFDVGLAAGQGPTPSRVATWKEIYGEALRRLNEEERQLQDLRDQGLEWAAIAQRLGGSADSRRKQWERARSRIAEELQLEE